MAGIHDITDENFENIVLGAKEVFVLDFFSDWCPPCKAMKPVFNEVAEEFNQGVNFGKIDISANTQIPAEYSVLAIPTFIIFKGGEEVKRLSGVVSKDKFNAEIKKVL